MPVDFELLCMASPPLFRHNFNNLTTNFRLTALSNNVRNKLDRRVPMPDPPRPILIVRHDQGNEEIGIQINSNQVTSPNKIKKKVVFADDKGMTLTEVRIMTEPSDCPPKLKEEIMDQVTCGASASVLPDSWELTFPQPASDYLQFRKKVDTSCVCLENIIIKETEDEIMGTIKVKNLTFDKEVIVRVTFDSWKTSSDIMATFVPSGTEGTAVYDLYDTFSFSVILPSEASNSRRIEFCVCFRSGGKEYWDNNNGSNYVLVCSSKNQPIEPSIPKNSDKFQYAFTANLSEWSNFSSWNHLLNDLPYY